MGVIKRGILGGFSGKVANVIGSSWKGIAVMKAMPLSVANPNTAAQVAQRTKMTNAVAFAKVILVTIIKPLCDRFASGQSGFNLFIQRNISLFTVADPAPASNLILSIGNVTPTQDLTIAGQMSDGQCDLAWTDNTGVGNALATDVPHIVIYNQNRNTFVIEANGSRSDAGVGFDLPEGTILGDTLQLWMSFRRLDGTQVSNTGYATTIVVA